MRERVEMEGGWGKGEGREEGGKEVRKEGDQTFESSIVQKRKQ